MANLHIIARNASEAFVLLCREAINWPREKRRDNIEMMDSPGPIMVEILHPTDRVLNVPGRGNSLPAAAAETLWVLAGKHDIDWLKFYLPRAPDFSDNGKTWRAGYGPRIRTYGDYNVKPIGDVGYGRDQLAFVVNELNNELNSRRAVITLFDPEVDITSRSTIVMTKDFPCTQSLSFMVRGGKLDLTVFIRSNDLIWGWSGVNAFEFTVMQQLVAEMIDVPVGRYYQVSNNLHVYNRHFEMVEKIAKINPKAIKYFPSMPGSVKIKSIDMLDELLREFYILENQVRNRNFVVSTDTTNALHESGYPTFSQKTFLRDIGLAALVKCAQDCSSKTTKDYFLHQISNDTIYAKLKTEQNAAEVRKRRV